MIKYWVKNRSWITLLWILVLNVAICVFFIMPNIENGSNNYSKQSIYKNSQIDYDIPAPTKEQLKQIENLDFVNAVFGYYYTEVTGVVNKTQKVNIKIIFSDYTQNIDMTMYSKERLIEASQNICENPIYIDYGCKNKNNIKLDDTIEIFGIMFQVAGIYETNSYNSAIYAPLIGEQKKMIEEKSSNYSGAFISVNDLQQAEKYFRSYKPYGRLRDKKEFDSEEQYLIHYNAWESANYYNEITRLDVKADNLSSEDIIPSWIILAVVFSVTIFIDIILFKRKVEYPYFVAKKYKKDILRYYKCDFIWQILILCFSGGALYYYYSYLYEGFIHKKTFYSEGGIYIGIMFGTSIFTYLFNCLLYKTKIKNKNSLG